MEVKEGMKCRFKCSYSGRMHDNGIVISVENDGRFIVAEDLKCPPQYNDSYTTFTMDQIGKDVFFEEYEQQKALIGIQEEVTEKFGERAIWEVLILLQMIDVTTWTFPEYAYRHSSTADIARYIQENETLKKVFSSQSKES